MSSSSAFSLLVAERVKAARLTQGHSLSHLAKQAGLGKGSLSELEAGRRNPTLATLYSLADALGVPLSHLLPDAGSQQPQAEVASPGIRATLLHSTVTAEQIVEEVFLLTLTAGEKRFSTAHPAGTTEHLYLTSGHAEVGPTAATQTLHAGESLTFQADTEHRYEALSTTARAVLTILTPLDPSA